MLVNRLPKGDVDLAGALVSSALGVSSELTWFTMVSGWIGSRCSILGSSVLVVSAAGSSVLG